MYDGRSRFREPSFDALQCQIDEAFDKIRELRHSMDDFNDKNVVPNLSEKLQILSERINDNKKMLEEHIKVDPPASIWLSGKVMIVLAAAAAIIGAAWVQAYIVPLFVRPHP